MSPALAVLLDVLADPTRLSNLRELAAERDGCAGSPRDSDRGTDDPTNLAATLIKEALTT